MAGLPALLPLLPRLRLELAQLSFARDEVPTRSGHQVCLVPLARKALKFFDAYQVVRDGRGDGAVSKRETRFDTERTENSSSL